MYVHLQAGGGWIYFFPLVALFAAEQVGPGVGGVR